MKNAYELIKKKKSHQKKRGKNINRQFTEEEMEVKEVEVLAQGHSVIRCWDWEMNPGLSNYRAHIPPT